MKIEGAGVHLGRAIWLKVHALRRAAAASAGQRNNKPFPSLSGNVSTRRRGQRGVIMVVLVCFATIAIPLGRADASHMEGTPWYGSIHTSIAFTITESGYFRTIQTAEADYSNLHLLGVESEVGLSDVSALYDADVDVSVNQKNFTYYDGSYLFTSSQDGSFNGPSSAIINGASFFGPYAFQTLDSDGATFWSPSSLIIHDLTSLGINALSFQVGYNGFPDQPLVDYDPDPDHLVGSTT